MSRKKKQTATVAVIDFETDPFLFMRAPRPFKAGFYDLKDGYKEFSGDNCATQLIIYLESRQDPMTIYAHNGGKFDFFFLLEEGALENPVMMINSRIVKCRTLGIHEVRDSYAMMPIPLRAYQKLDIDYAKLERDVRDQHDAEISKYLKMDCVYLFELVTKFIDQFGAKLTVGAAAISEVLKFHPVPRRDARHDKAFRPFYFGGRVECFEKGKLIPSAPGKKLKIFDVNSMYPKAMHAYDHPASGIYIRLDDGAALARFDHKTGKIKGFGGVYFIKFTGSNKGALPMRKEDGGLTFDCEYGEFFACSHEVKAACELGLITVDKIDMLYICSASSSYKEFVDHWMAEKISCKESGDKAGEIFAKLMLNSAYGKMATDPTKFKDYFILDNNDYESIESFEQWKHNGTLYAKECSSEIESEKDARALYKKLVPTLVQDNLRFEIWVCGAPDDNGYFDVAIGASITSAARSILLRAIHACDRPLYCDTDSLICEGLDGVEIHDSALGAWKFEGETDTLYVAGKKMYAAIGATLDKDGTRKDKIASKGAKLSSKDIAFIAQNPDLFVTWQSDAPNFGLDGSINFNVRKIRATA